MADDPRNKLSIGGKRFHIPDPDATFPELGPTPNKLEDLVGARSQRDDRPSSLIDPLTANPNQRAEWHPQVRQADERIRDLLNNIDNAAFEVLGIGGKFAPNAIAPHSPFGAQGTLGLDPRIYTKSLINIGNALGKSGLALFGVQQATLFALNNDGQQIWDPLYFVNRAPIINNFIPVAHDPNNPLAGVNDKPGLYEQRILTRENNISEGTQLTNYLKSNDRFNLRVTNDYNPPFNNFEVGIGFAGTFAEKNMNSPRSAGAASQDGSLLPRDMATDSGLAGLTPIPIVDLALKIRNLYTPPSAESPGATAAYEINARWTVGEIVDAIIDETDSDLIVNKPIPGQTNIDRKRFNLSSVFEKNRVDLGWAPTQASRSDIRTAKYVRDSTLAAAAFPEGIIPMNFSGEDDDGSITHDGVPQDVDGFYDDQVYVPVSFTDVRPFGNNDGKFRTVYFRPIITSLTEDFAPEWDKKTFYGRHDQVVTYMSTLRTIFLGLELHAFAPEDVKVMYQKLNWLASMVYPEYDSERLLKAGPVCRMRVGDVIKSGQLGLPGVIDSLSFDYTDSIWELKKGSKVPRSIRVSISFHVLHDTIIGRGENGKFGTIGRVGPDGKFRTSRSESTFDIVADDTGKTSRVTKTGTHEVSTQNKVESSNGFRGFGNIDGKI